MDRLIFHIDVNSAFLSWESARRVKKGESDLRLVPSAVGGDRDRRTGVILAKSIPAKKYGVSTGEPVSMALRKCPELVIVKPDFRLYAQCSKKFLAICRKYAPVVEQFSIDECFLDMSGTSRIYPDPVAIAHTIKDEIRDRLGFTVNVGIGPNKLLAKMASDFEKPDKVHTLFFDELEEKFYPLPVRDLFTVGRSTAKLLDRINVHTIGELASLDQKALDIIVGGKFAKHLYLVSHGLDDSPVLAERPEAKGYSNSITLEEDVTTAEEAEQVLLLLSDSVATRLRADSVRAWCVSVVLRSTDFTDRSKQMRLDTPTDNTDEVFDKVKKLFLELWDGEDPIRLFGVAAFDVTKEEGQLSFFDDPKKEKSRDVDEVVDSIRERFGMDTIIRGSICKSPVVPGGRHLRHSTKADGEEKNKKQ
ncbi:MAG: DNA polymerase IV [Clostridia bacterium]|nr:DNA polymerase IV [Clostridia bacterium]